MQNNLSTDAKNLLINVFFNGTGVLVAALITCISKCCDAIDISVLLSSYVLKANVSIRGDDLSIVVF